MRTALCIAAVIAVAVATPSGYYHQQYNYKTSSSSYRNNELQHKTDDQGYYSKDGDLEGRVKPKVSSNSEHSEYVNPSLRETGNAGYYDTGSDLTSHGNMLANSYGASVGGQVSSGYNAGSAQYASNLNSEGLASSDYIGAASGYSGSYSSGSEAAYESAGLRTLGSRLQSDLQHELESAVHDRAQYVNVDELESELRRNLTARLNEILKERFGTQTIRGGQSYSLISGQLQARPNYNQQDLEQLQKQIERSLLDELKQEYNYRTSHSSQQRINQNYERFEVTTTYRPTTYTYRPIYPSLNTVGTQNQYSYGQQTAGSLHNEYNANRYTSNVEYSQVPNAPSITTIASNVQRDLNNQLNRLLEEAQRQYFSESSRSTTYNTASILDRLKQELRSNLTYALDEELRRNFGTQLQKNGYMFTVRTDGGTTNQYNYNVADLESLRRQVEENLLTKLTRDFEAARQHWISTQQSHSQQRYFHQSNSNDYVSNNLGYDYSTPRYPDNDYYRPTSASIVPLISSGVKGNKYQAASGSHYETSGSSSNIAQLQRQLQADLSSQLQAALSQNKAYASRYSSGDSHASFEEAYRRLYEELQRNLTQQLQSFEAGSSAYSNSYGSVNQNQLAQLRSQLQNSLASQLQQGLQQSYSASASFSASAGSSASAGAGAYSSSNSGGYYRAARGSDNQYGQYRLGGDYLAEGEDCQGDDPLAHQYHRSKRSYRSRPLGLSTQTGAGYNSRGTYGGYSGYSRYTPTGQEEDNSEIIEPGQRYPNHSNQGAQNIGQEIDDTDDTQQIEIDPGFTIGQHPTSQNHLTVGQEEDNSDDTQQIQVEHGFSSIGLGSQSSQINTDTAHKPNFVGTEDTLGQNNRRQYQATISGNYGGLGYNGINTQSTERSNIRQNSLYGSQITVGQEEDDSDDTQQIQTDPEFSPIGLGSSSLHVGFIGTQNQKPSSSRTEQSFGQVAHQTNFESQRVLENYKPNFSTTEKSTSNKPQNPVGQEEDNSDYLQQVENNNFDGIGVASQNRESNGSVRVINAQSNHRTYQINHGYLNSGYQPYRPYGSRDHVRRFPETDGTNPSLNKNDNIPDIETGTPLNQQSAVIKPDIPTQVGSVGIPEISSTQINNGQQVDDTDTIQNSVNDFYRSSNVRPVDGFDTLQNSESKFNSFERSTKPVLNSNIMQTPSTPKNQFSLQFGTQNVIPESETVQPLHIEPSTPEFFQQPSFVEPVQPNRPTIESQRTTPRSPRGDIPSGLEQFSTDLEENLTNQLGEIVKNNLPSSASPTELYNEILHNLKTNITTDCQKILKNSKYSYLNVNQRDIDQLEKTIEAHLVQTLNSYFKSYSFTVPSTAGSSSLPQLPWQSIPQQLPNNHRGYWQTYSYKPKQQISSNTFLQREINAQDDTYQINVVPKSTTVLPVESDSLNVFSQTSGQQFLTDFSSTSPSSAVLLGPIQQPEVALIPSQSQTSDERTRLREAENEADLLIQKLSNHLRDRQTQSSNINQESDQSTTIHNYQPQTQIIRVRLDNLTPEQLNIINQIENEFSNIIDSAVQDEYTSTYSQHNSKYELYRISINKLEEDLRKNLSDCIQGTIPQLEHVNLQKYSDLVNRKFEHQKISDVQKYLEIRLIKKIRAQLGRLYNIETNTYESESNSRVEHTYQKPVIYQPRTVTRVVTLENITPVQLNIIQQIEKDILAEIEDIIKTQISSLRQSSSSKYYYQQALKDLEVQLKNNVTEKIQRICEPGMSQYSQLIFANFDKNKISDLEKYIEIKLVNKVTEKIMYYSEFEATANSHIRHQTISSSHHFGSTYHSYNEENDESEVEPDSSYHRPAVIPPTSLNQQSVKGGNSRTIYNPNFESPNTEVTKKSTHSSEFGEESEDSTESTTPAESWWKRFGNKVKKGASKLKEKIIGES